MIEAWDRLLNERPELAMAIIVVGVGIELGFIAGLLVLTW